MTSNWLIEDLESEFTTHVFVHNKTAKEMVKLDHKTELYNLIYEADIFKMYTGILKNVFSCKKHF